MNCAPLLAYTSLYDLKEVQFLRGYLREGEHSMAKNLRLPFSKTRDIQISFSRPFRKDFTKLPQVDPKTLLPDLIDVKLVNLDQADDNISCFEQVVLMGLAKARKCTSIFELGTYLGWTTRNFALNLGNTAEIITIDLPAVEIDNTALSLDQEDTKYVLKDKTGRDTLLVEKNIKQFLGDTAQFDFTPFHRTCDFVFVDASHSYDYVLNDSSIALSLLKKSGGTVVWHDYGTWEGVTKALNELFQNDKRFHGMRHIRGTTMVMLEMEEEFDTPRGT